jgi:hypothetical protein
MEESLKSFLERTTPFGALARFQRQRQLRKKLRLWKRNGAVGPMPNLGKQQVVREYIERFSPEVFVETGTYKGKMVYAVMPYIKEIYSIELDQNHYRNARKKFAGYPNIHIIQGQSGQILPRILRDIDKRCLFWLDAHWSKGSTARGDLQTPIMQEIKCILNHPRADEHAILVDDARLFVGADDYPALQTLQSYVLSFRPDWIFEVKDDIIRSYHETI